MNIIVYYFLIFLSIISLISSYEVIPLSSNLLREKFDNNEKFVLFVFSSWCSSCRAIEKNLEKVNIYMDDRHKTSQIPKIPIYMVQYHYYYEAKLNYTLGGVPSLLYIENRDIFKYSGPRDTESLKQMITLLEEPDIIFLKSKENLVHDMASFHNSSFILTLPCDINESSFNQLETLSGCDERQLNIFNDYLSISPSLKLETTLGFLYDPSSKGKLCKYDTTSKEISQFELSCHYITEEELSNKNSLFYDKNNLKSWILNNNYPLVSEFESHDFYRLSNLDHTMVIIVDSNLNPTRKSLMMNILSIYSKNDINNNVFINIHNNNNNIYGYLDSTKYYKYCDEHGIPTDFPSLLFIKHETSQYYLKTFEYKDSNEDKYNQELDKFIRSTLDSFINNEVEFLEQNKDKSLSRYEKIIKKINRYYSKALLLFSLPIIFIILSFLNPNPKKFKSH